MIEQGGLMSWNVISRIIANVHLYVKLLYSFICFTVTVADYANADPAIVKSGRVKKAVANAIEKEGKLCNNYV